MAFSKYSTFKTTYPQANGKVEFITSGGNFLIQNAGIQVVDCNEADAIKIKNVDGTKFIMGLCVDKIIGIRFLN